ncbi:hypothetical protein [Enterococcus faecium]|uniref:hypothetical protein n=1 Tax=Enterococcus faecium TaxID=1352 RepID=UPI001E2BABB6|nr:hypothetical protein [Enterococcus faecium]
MKKSHIVTLATIFLLCVAAFFFFTNSPKNNKHITARTATTESTIKTETVYPSLNELKQLQGSDIEVLGKTQITTVLFQNKNMAILTTENNKEIQLPLIVTDKKNNLFEIPSLTYSKKNLKVGEVFGLAKKDNHYLAYKL